jgi:hypothetical protein
LYRKERSQMGSIEWYRRTLSVYLELEARLESRSGELKRTQKKRPFPVSVQTDVRLGMFTQ